MPPAASSAPSPRPSPATWSGRTDGSGPEHRRWHAVVRQAGPEPEVPGPGPDAGHGLGLLGFCTDEGVRRNGGRPGAAAGPAALRAALGNLALHEDLDVLDLGDVHVAGTGLEQGQQQVGAQVAALLTAGRLPLVLGGGHETAYGTFLGLDDSGMLRDRRLGIVNLDAHFDLRKADVPTSGTPFLQIAEHQAAAGREFCYRVVGLSRPSNTGALFATADRLGVGHRLDEDCQDLHDGELLAELAEFARGVDALYLTVDLDVLPAAVAPGVSAPAALGVPLAVVLGACRALATSGKLVAADVTELNPHHDVDQRTARAGALIVHTIAVAALRSAPRAGGAPT